MRDRLQALIDHPRAPLFALAACSLLGVAGGVLGPWDPTWPLAPRLILSTLVGAFCGFILTARRLIS